VPQDGGTAPGHGELIIEYRNYVRGHCALGGKPSITRLNEEHSRVACFRYARPSRKLCQLRNRPPHPVARLELPDVQPGSPRGHHALKHGSHLLETLDGLEARMDGQSIAILRDWRTYGRMSWCDLRKLPTVLNFEPYGASGSPRIAVAN